MNEIRKITKSTIIYLLGSVSSKLVALLLLKVYTSYISPYDLGAFDVNTNISTLVASVLFLDIWCGVMRFMFEKSEKDHQYGVVYSGGIIFLGSTIIYTIVFVILGVFFNIQYVGWVYAYGLALCIQSFYGTVARAFGFNINFAISGVCATFVNAILNIILLIGFSIGYKALFIAYVAGNIVQCIMLERHVKLIRNFSIKKIKRDVTKEIFVFSLPLCVNSAAFWLLSGYGTIAINDNLGKAYSGYYNVAVKFGVMITLVSFAFSMAWQEMAYAKTGDDEATGNFYTKATDLYVKLLFCGTIVLIPFIFILFPYLTTKEYIIAKPIIPFYILATVLTILATFLGNILTAYKKTSTIFISTLCACIVNLVIIYLFINKIGLITVPIALFSGYLVNCIIRIQLIKRVTRFKYNIKNLVYIVPIITVTVLVYQSNKLWLNVIIMLLAITFSIVTFREYIRKILFTFKGR